MNWVFDTANRKRKVDLGVTGEFPSLANAAPNRRERRTRDPSIDSVGDLSGNLRQSETSVQNRVQAFPSIDNRGDIDYFAIRAGNTVLVKEDLPVLVNLVPERNLSDGEFWHGRDFLEALDEFAHCDISGIEICGVIRPPKQGGEIIGRRCVGEEDTVQDCVPCRRVDDFPNV